MELLEKNQDLSPFKVCLCILLYEGLTSSPSMSTSDRAKILKFIIKHIQSSEGHEILYAELLDSLAELTTDPGSLDFRGILVTKLAAMSDFSDLLQLFIQKLNELKSDGEISSGCLEQGGILYLFLRKCFVSFARMGFEDLVSLWKRLDDYKSHKPLKQNSKTLASKIAGALDELVLTEDYKSLSEKIFSLNTDSKYLLQGHLDALYNKNSAIDNIHRYFDLILDQKMPTKTMREKGLVVVQSSTHFASLHRVKIELQLNHLEAAVHLLVETIKRALSENDNLVILESTLLFMKIAGMMGNFKQEQRISEKAVLHALKLSNIEALIKSTLFYSQLHLECSQGNSALIFTEITPKPDVKGKMAQLVAKKLSVNKKLKTWSSLCDYTLLESLTCHDFKSFIKSVKFISATSWLHQGYDWNLMLNLKSLQSSFEYSLSEVEFYLSLARTLYIHNKAESLNILKFIDSKCKEKSCISWNFTLYYIAHIRSVQTGSFLEAEYLEQLAEQTCVHKCEVKLMRLQRLLGQKHLKSGFDLGNELIVYYTEKGLTLKACEVRMILSQILMYSNEHYRALSVLNKCLEHCEEFNCLEVQVKTLMADASVLAFTSPLVSLNLLNSVDVQIFNKNSPYLRGRYYRSKAKVALAVSRELKENSEGEVLRKALLFLEQAEEEFLIDNSLCELREIYYIQARAYDKMNDESGRKFYSDKFCSVNKEINLNSKSLIKRDEDINLEFLSD